MISTHILDTSVGLPAAGVAVQLEILENGTWKKLFSDTTNIDGRLKFECQKIAGSYQLRFDVEAYFKAKNLQHFFLNTPVAFKITDLSRNYHVPLLLNPYGYSTYRGS